MIIFNRTAKSNCLIFDKNRSKVDGGFHIYLKEIIKLPGGTKKYKYEISFAINSESFVKSSAHRIIVTPIPPGLGSRKQLKIQTAVAKLNSGLLNTDSKILKKSAKNRLIKATTLDEINLTEHASWVTEIPVVADLLWKGCESGEVLIEAMSFTASEASKEDSPVVQLFFQPLVKFTTTTYLYYTIVEITQNFKKATAVGTNPDNVIDETKSSYVLKRVDEIKSEASKDSLYAQEAIVTPQFDGGEQKKELNTAESMVAVNSGAGLDTDKIFEASTRYRSAVDILEGNIGEKTSDAQDVDSISVVWSDEESFEDSVIEKPDVNTGETSQEHIISFESLEEREPVNLNTGFQDGVAN